MIKLIAIDADGTLLNSESAISGQNRQTISRCIQQGIKVVFITGKNLKAAKRIINTFRPPNPQVVSNGTLIVDQGLNHLDYRLINSGSVKSIIEFARKTGQLLFLSTLDGDLVYEQGLSEVAHKHYMRKVDDLMDPDIAGQVLLATILKREESGPIDALSIGQNLKDIKIRDAGFNYVNIFSRQAGKTFALNKVLHYLGLEPSQVMAIGDGENDLGIISMAGVGVAMGNACQKLKQAADWVTEDLDHHGVSIAIKKVLGF